MSTKKKLRTVFLIASILLAETGSWWAATDITVDTLLWFEEKDALWTNWNLNFPQLLLFGGLSIPITFKAPSVIPQCSAEVVSVYRLLCVECTGSICTGYPQASTVWQLHSCQLSPPLPCHGRDSAQFADGSCSSGCCVQDRTPTNLAPPWMF